MSFWGHNSPITRTSSGPLRVAHASSPSPAVASCTSRRGLVPLGNSAFAGPQNARGELFLHRNRSFLRSQPHSDRNLSSLPQTSHLCHVCPVFPPSEATPYSCLRAVRLVHVNALLCSSNPALCRPLAPGALGWEEIFCVVRTLRKPQSQIPAGLIQRMKTCSVGDSPSGRPALTASG